LELQLSSVSGGSKDNAIPREADVKFIINDFTKAKEIISEYEGIFKNELRVSDKDIRLEVEEIEINELFGKEESSKIVETIQLHPNGIKSMSLDIEGLVESSLNLGVIVTNENSVTLHSAIRSSVLSQKMAMVEVLKTLAKVMNISFTDSAHYPAWQYREHSKIRDIFEKTYEKINGKKPKIKAIHAGLECGLFDEKFDDIDMISFGPDIRNAHTPEEMVNIASIERVWNYFVEVMKATKENY
ncbi:MAG: M20/M25/M40 family metallo-hydrolase, partial [Fusobacteriaceae bacterium]|nr:M20/M25/M40 family metallo-hydrolase [Fusobacteriaceae bacterium]